MSPRVAKCGTRSGYNRHLRLGQSVCPECRRATADNPGPKAQSRAKTVLVHRHKAEYDVLYAQFLSELKADR